MYISPITYKCNRCGHECEYSPHHEHPAPTVFVNSDEMIACPRCWLEWLRQNIGGMEPKRIRQQHPQEKPEPEKEASIPEVVVAPLVFTAPEVVAPSQEESVAPEKLEKPPVSRRTSSPGQIRKPEKTPRVPRPPRKQPEKKEIGAVRRVVSAALIGHELRSDLLPRKSSAGRKSKVGELMERALTDSSFFPAYKNWPVLDLCLYGAEMDNDDDDDVNYIKLFPADKWVTELARPLNFHVLKTPGSDEWKSAYAIGLFQQDKKVLRGRAMRIQPFEKAKIGPLVMNHKVKEQKYANPYDRAINYPGLEVFTMRVFGDPSYFSKHGAYSMQLAVSPKEAFALSESGVLQRLDRDPDHPERSQADLIRMRIRLNCGMQLAAEVSWRVVLQYQENRPRVSFMANSEIVKELLTLRKCSDRVKKQRMIHIVSAHTRRIREEEVTDVMRHYRGSTETLWNGCTMQIIPPISETDLMSKMTAKITEIREVTDTIQPPKMIP